MNKRRPFFEINELRTSYAASHTDLFPVNGISFQLEKGETLAIVGESGCGKSTLAHAILRLIQKPGNIHSGEIWLEDRDLLKLSEREMRTLRGRDTAMVFQDPMSAFHPLMRLGDQLTESIKEGSAHSKKQMAIEMLEWVGLPDPVRQMKSYSYELSGGMLQRVMIAMALLNRPKLLIADEPTTALDVTVQAHVLNLFRKMKASFGMGMLFISHDLAVVAEVADRVAVMHQGKIVECGKVQQLFRNPQHAYTRHLLEMAPVLQDAREEKQEKKRQKVAL
ncbi:ABC transporter ATP-binding protein [Paenibacillus sp. SI8]|uniref:ABC transporter ATP-binding protein n=1 Tax=unclassified Paenibacillus TaxID=185978 RepID=UPI0034659A69